MRNWPLTATVAGAALTLVAWASWSMALTGPAAAAAKLASQILLLVPVLLGAGACAARVRVHWAWLVPLSGFVLAVPLAYEAWEDRSRPAGEESCDAVGFLPQARDWFEHERYGAAALAVLAAGLVALAWPRTRTLGGWVAASAFTWFAAFVARGVCVGT